MNMLKKNKYLFVLAMVIFLSFTWTEKAKALTKPTLINIDSPRMNQTINNQDIYVGGWALDESGVSGINILVDNVKIGQATIGLSRPDVNSVFPGYIGGDKSGFFYNINVNSIKPGVRKITVQEIGNNGVITESSININVQKPAPLANIDVPITNQNFKNGEVFISGWTLNASGVKLVNILVDKKNVGQANVGISRLDVGKVFPMYKDSDKSGFNYSLNINNVLVGSHEIIVQAVGNDGTTVERSIKFNIARPNPILTVDSPVINQTINNQDISINGWALNDSGVNNINVLLDNQIIGQATQNISRPDVGNAYPGYLASDKSGYNYVIKVDSIKPGSHVIVIRATGNDGSIVEKSVSINVRKLDNITTIDTPTENEIRTNSSIIVSGWSLNASGISKVNVLVDGTLWGEATTGISRLDVNAVFPGYKNGSNSGYTFSIDVHKITSGNHRITVQAIGNDGTVSERTVQIQKALPIINVDNYRNNDVIKNTIYVSGWALNVSGVQKIDTYLDGRILTSTNANISRPDVDKVYPGYLGGAQSGFMFQVDTTRFTNGIHTLSIVSIGADGVNCTKIIYLNFQNDTYNYIKYNNTLAQMVDIQSKSGAVYYNSGNWVAASKEQIQYYLDYNNFINDSYGKYMFLRLNFTLGISAADIDKMLVGKGVLQGKGQVFLDAAQNANISPVYLVSHALLETGNGTSDLATGKLVVNGRPVYNIFGIHAFDSDPNKYGSEFAYQQGWFTVDDAIRGGAVWISGYYVNSSTYNQNTLYKMRWNPQTPGEHQYATDIGWAYKQITNIKKLLDMCSGAVQMFFDIPQFN